MIYEKPAIRFQKFHTDPFLDQNVLSSTPTDMGGDIFGGDDDNDDWEFEPTAYGFNGTISLGPDGVGGWFNG
ncbi:MAG: hypothetical protein MJ147_07635 [Clostridia bacterium]|nr:hypothetical protein [Clostridia bacterium]